MLLYKMLEDSTMQRSIQPQEQGVAAGDHEQSLKKGQQVADGSGLPEGGLEIEDGGEE